MTWEVFILLVVVFFGLSLFYRFTPSRPRGLPKSGPPALCETVLFRAGERLFIISLKAFATLSAVYGTFAGRMVLLLWIYVSGYVRSIQFFSTGVLGSWSKSRARKR